MARILIADDDPILRALVSDMLGEVGHGVEEAEDGQQAVDLLLARPFDLLIVDMLMPNKDGLEVIMETRKSGSALPIIAITSGGRMDAPSLLKPAQIFGADAVLAKPLHADTLIKTIDWLLREVRIAQ